MDAAQTPKAIRPVGSMAKLNTSRHHLGLCRSVVLTGRYAAPNGNADVPSVYRAVRVALASVIDKHPMLRVGIADEGSPNPMYVELPTIDLRDVIEWKVASSEDYTRFLLRSIEAQHDRLWEHLDRRPAWKIIVHQPDSTAQAGVQLDISFAFHHAIGDGQSAMIFHRDFLHALNDIFCSDDDLNEHVVHLKPAADLPQPLEAIVPFTVSWMYFCIVVLSRIWDKFAPSWLRAEGSPNMTPWTGKHVTIEPYKTNLRLVHLSDGAVSSLIAACREHGTTLTPLLQALVLVSLSSRPPATSAPSFRANTPISLRRCTTAEFDRENTIHCLVTGHDHLFTAPVVSELRETISHSTDENDAEHAIWKAATELGTDLKTKLANLPRNDAIALLPWVSDWKQFWLDQVGQPPKDSWECSNAGTLDKVLAGDWEIESLVFSQGALPMGPAFSVNIAGVEGRGLSMTVSWQESVLDAELVDGVAGDLQAWVDRFGRNGHMGVRESVSRS